MPKWPGITTDDFIKALEYVEEVLADQYLEKYCAIHGWRPKGWTFQHVDSEDLHFEYYSQGGSDWLAIPTRYLFDPEWETKERARMELEAKQEAEKEQARKKAELAARQAEERRLYQVLKKKFETREEP